MRRIPEDAEWSTCAFAGPLHPAGPSPVAVEVLYATRHLFRPDAPRQLGHLRTWVLVCADHAAVLGADPVPEDAV